MYPSILSLLPSVTTRWALPGEDSVDSLNLYKWIFDPPFKNLFSLTKTYTLIKFTVWKSDVRKYFGLKKSSFLGTRSSKYFGKEYLFKDYDFLNK